MFVNDSNFNSFIDGIQKQNIQALKITSTNQSVLHVEFTLKDSPIKQDAYDCSLSPENQARLFSLSAQILSNNQDDVRAVEYYERSISIVSNKSDNIAPYFKFLLRLENIDRALELYLKYIKDDLDEAFMQILIFSATNNLYQNHEIILEKKGNKFIIEGLDKYISSKNFNADNALALMEYVGRVGIEVVFKSLLRKGIKPNYKIYEFAVPQIQRLLNYRPGRNHPTLYHYLYASDFKLENLSYLLEDYDDTTDATSSDLDFYDEQEGWETQYFYMNDQNFPDLDGQGEYSDEIHEKDTSTLLVEETKHRKAYVESYNQAIKKSQPELNFDDKTYAARFLLFRGMSFSPDYFSHQKRFEVCSSLTKSQPAVSLSTLTRAGLENEIDVSEVHAKFLDADKYEKDFFSHMPEETQKNFFEEYLKQYQTLFERSFTQKYQHDTALNPIVSLTCKLSKALLYGGGRRFNTGLKVLNPHYRRFTLLPKHPHVGWVDIYLMDLPYFLGEGRAMNDFIHDPQSGFNVSCFYWHDHESCFISSIPSKYHLGRKIFSLPALNNAILKNKQNILQNIFSKNSKDSENAIKALFDTVAKKISPIIENKIKLKLLARNPWLVFPYYLTKGHIQSTCADPSSQRIKYRHPEENASLEDSLFSADFAEDLSVTEFSEEQAPEISSQNYSIIFNFIIDDFINHDFKVHGINHAIRTAIWCGVIRSLYEKFQPEAVQEIVDPFYLLQFVALLHDVGRKKDKGPDVWETESAELCAGLLKSFGFAEELAVQYGQMILEKDSQTDKDINAKILHDADCLDRIRCSKEFYIDRLDSYQDLKGLHSSKDMIIKIVCEVAMFICAENDLVVSSCELKETSGGDCIKKFERNRNKPNHKDFDECVNTLEDYQILSAFYHSKPTAKKRIMPKSSSANLNEESKMPREEVVLKRSRTK